MTEVDFQESSVELIYNTMKSEFELAQYASVGYPTDERGESKDKRLLKYLIREGHGSIFEHATLSFFITMPSIVAIHLLTHRTLHRSTSNSGRYRVPTNQFMNIYRTDIGVQAEKDHQSRNALAPNENEAEIEEIFHQFFQSSIDTYEKLKDLGCPRELARMVCCGGNMTSYTYTGTLRAWINFCCQRDTDHTQIETRTVAVLIRNILSENFPVTMGYVQFESVGMKRHFTL